MTDETSEDDNSLLKKAKTSSSTIISLISGVGAGIVCTIFCAPLDVAKVRLQIQGSIQNNDNHNASPKYNGQVIQAVRLIFKEEGIRGIFKGIGPALITVPLFWGIYFPIYNNMKSYFNEDHGYKSYAGHVYSAIIAGAVGDLVTNPFWVTRTRIQTMALHPSNNLSANISTLEMMRVIYINEGIGAFYRGLGASFLGLSHVAIQFPLYEYLKSLARDKRYDGKESFIDILASSMIAKFVASGITYPHEVLRARLQDSKISYRLQQTSGNSSLTSININNNSNNRGLIALFKEIVQKEGILALWSGLKVSLTRIIPATASTFVSYEYISRYLNDKAIQSIS